MPTHLPKFQVTAKPMSAYPEQDRTDRLHHLMRHHRLTTRQVAEILNRTPSTVRSWFNKFDNTGISKRMLELLESAIEARAREMGGAS